MIHHMTKDARGLETELRLFDGIDEMTAAVCDRAEAGDYNVRRATKSMTDAAWIGEPFGSWVAGGAPGIGFAL